MRREDVSNSGQNFIDIIPAYFHPKKRENKQKKKKMLEIFKRIQKSTGMS